LEPRRCEHEADPRRVCDACTDAPFIACSLACLGAHLRDEHAGVEAGAGARALAYLERVNANVQGDRETFAGHRARVMALIEAAARGGSLCVLGAGNGSDLDVPALAQAFDEVHLVDLDGAALARCHAGLPAKVRKRVTLHAGIDLTGFIDRLDDWGEAFPAAAELGPAAVGAIQGILRRLGRRFDVVVSTCALSQLAVPYHRAWVLPAAAWAQLHDATTAVHLSTLAGATEPGGAGVLIFDVLSSRQVPELRGLEGAPQVALDAFLNERVAAEGALGADPEPESLLRRLRSPGLERLVDSPRLTQPWLWNIGAESQLVYGLIFRRP
jgi:hypothetical protein